MFLSRRSNGIYYLWYLDERGVYRKVSTRTCLRSEAAKFLRSFNEEERVQQPASPMLSQFAEEYLGYSASLHRPATSSTVKYCFIEFSRFIGDRPLDKIGVREIESFLVRKRSQASDFTARKHYATLAAAFERAKKWGYITKNPFRDAQKPKIREVRPAHFCKSDFQRLLQVIEDEDFKALCITAVTTGLRLSEIISLRWAKVDLGEKLIMVENSEQFTTKSGRSRAVPISEQLCRLLTLCREKASCELVFARCGRQLTRDMVSHRFKAYVRRAGLDESLHFHSLRHTFATWLVQERVSLYEVQKLLGHSSILVTQVYSHLASSELHEAVNRIPDITV
jgi:integrase